MHITRFALLAAASSSIALASSAPDILNEIRGTLHGAGSRLQPRQSKNLQSFSGALGGIKADAVTQTSDSQRPFEVDGDTFTDFASAAGRSCDNQKNNCAQMANSGNGSFTVSDCDTQNTQCKADITNESASVSAGSDSTTTTTTSSSSSSSTSTSTSTTSSSTSTLTSSLSTTSSATLALVSQNAEFNFFCEV